MYTTLDKAIVALIMGVIGIVNLLGFHFGMAEGAVSAIVVGLTPILVYLWPNAPKDS